MRIAIFTCVVGLAVCLSATVALAAHGDCVGVGRVVWTGVGWVPDPDEPHECVNPCAVETDECKLVGVGQAFDPHTNQMVQFKVCGCVPAAGGADKVDRLVATGEPLCDVVSSYSVATGALTSLACSGACPGATECEMWPGLPLNPAVGDGVAFVCVCP